jgi:succinate dehydrogenase / fumarate reductase, cytochrome b subunit
MADVNRGNRPLSPHLQIYRMPMTGILSITHRITGVAMVPGAVLVVWWFVAAVYSPAYFAAADRFLTSWFGTLVMLGSLWALAYHFCNGIRHLVWDAGHNFDLEKTARANWIVLGGSAVLTVLVLLLV